MTSHRHIEDELRNVRRTTLPNGLTIVTEEISHLRSVSIGIWVRAGSRNEAPEINGISHFVEHMVFKGTTSRSAEDIARQVDSIGGNLDAFTAKETICFNLKVLDEHVPIAMDVISDLVLNPVFNDDDIVKERGVVQEEIKMDQDNPDNLVHELFMQNLWKDHPLGRPILGTRETVRKFQRPTLQDYYGVQFRPGNLVIAAAGHLKHDEFVALATSKFEQLKAGPPAETVGPPKSSARITLRNKKSLEQVQICVGVPSYSISHENRYASFVLNTLLGGGMSSRLFQNIRERQGLVYSIFSELNPYRDAGCLMVYGGTSRDAAAKVVGSVVAEFKQLKETSVSDEELLRSKAQLKGSLMLSLESTMARMSNLARQEMYYERFFGLGEIIERVEAVSADDVQRCAEEFFVSERLAVTVLGNLNGLKISRDQLSC